MQQEFFSIEKSLGLTRENGYEKSNLYIDEIPIDKFMHCVTATHRYKVFKMNDYDVYLVYPDKGWNNVFRHISVNEEELKEFVKREAKKGPFYYYKYDVKGNCDRGKQIVSHIRVNPKYEQRIENTIKKMELHKNISINILLHGPPGTGKSSFVEYVATKYKSNIYVPPPFDDGKMSTIFNSISAREQCIVLLPEIDKILNEHGEPIHSSNELYELLDGMNRPVNSFIIMTCNDVNKIKKNRVLSRPGRINIELEFTLANEEDIKFIVKKYFPDFTDFDLFKQYYDKISHAEFENAICQHYIMDEPLSKFKIVLKTLAEKKLDLYY